MEFIHVHPMINLGFISRSLGQKHLSIWNSDILNHQNQSSLRLQPTQALLELPAQCGRPALPSSDRLQEFGSLALVQLSSILLLDHGAQDTVLLWGGQVLDGCSQSVLDPSSDVETSQLHPKTIMYEHGVLFEQP